jgi:signal transduction histidine kinase/DNA-binding response OmpR family regulator/ligand-binding sensor domain-containing protein
MMQCITLAKSNVMITRSIILGILSILLVPSISMAQEYVVRTQTFELEDGLQHRQVLSINRDKNGVLWIGTKAGLQRYDGHDFKSWSKQNSNGLLENITAIGFDDQNFLWAWNTTKNAFSFVDLQSEAILSSRERFGEDFPIKSVEKNGRWVHQSEQLNADAQGKLWFVLSNPPALVSFSNSLFKSLPLPDVQGNIATLDFLDSKGNMWVESKYKDVLSVYKYNKTGILQGKWDFPNAIKAHRFSEKNQNVHFQVGFLEDEILYKHASGEVEAVSQTEANTHWWVSKGELSWEYRHGVWRMENGNRDIGFSKAQLHHEIFTTYPTTIYRDPENMLWVGNAWGLGLISWKTTAFDKLFSFNLDESKTFNNSARAILTFPDEVVQAFDFADIRSSKGTYIEMKDELQNPVCLHKENEESFWTASSSTSDNAIFILKYALTPQGWKIVEEYFIETYKEQPWSLNKTEKGEILIGTNKGLWVFDYRKKSSYKATDFLDDVEPFTTYQIHALGKNEYYLLTSLGIIHLDILDKKLINHFYSLSKETPLPCDEVYHMYTSSDDSIWLASNEGLILWNPKTNKNLLYHDLFALDYGSVYAVYPGAQKELWISSDYGLIRWDTQTKRSQVFLEEDGICHKEFNRISHTKSTDGTLYFGGLNGLTVFHPDDFKNHWTSDKGRKLFISSFKIHWKDQELNATAQARAGEPIVIPPNIQYISIRFSLPDFSGNKMNTYGWSLNGNWNRQESNVLYLSNLPFGENTLKLEGTSADGSLNKALNEIKIFKEKPFYMKNWFFLILLLLSILIILLLFRLRTRQLLRNKLKLEMEVEEATAKIRRDKYVIQQQAEELKEMDKIKTRFFNNVSHELRTPLSLILGPLQKAQTDAKSPSPLLEMSIRNARKLKKRIDELLDLAKSDAGKIKVQPQSISYENFIKNSLGSFSNLAEASNVQLHLTGDFSPGRVSIDPYLHEKILDNLLSNALKHSPEKGTIRVHFEKANGMGCLHVSDEGPGIPQEELENIFNRYHQTGSSIGGTGIGLALCRSLARDMGGQLTADNGEIGAVFTFTFPWIVPKGDALPERKSMLLNTEKKEHVPKPNESPAKILVVEDHEDLQLFIKSILEPHYTVQLSSNGKEALEYLKNNEIDLITSDIMMPVMDGFQLLDQLQKDERLKNIPVLMLTAKGSIESKLNAFNNGVSDYMVKPFHAEELLARVSNLWQRNQVVRDSLESTDKEEKVQSPQDEWLQSVQKCVMQNLEDSNFNVAQLADAVHTTEKTLTRRLKSYSGLTAGAYIKEIRMQHAYRILENGRIDSIQQLAFKCGYKRSDSFTSAFEKRFGRKPSSYLDNLEPYD